MEEKLVETTGKHPKKKRNKGKLLKTHEGCFGKRHFSELKG